MSLPLHCLCGNLSLHRYLPLNSFSSILHTHILQGTRPGWVREKVRQNKEGVVDICCNKPSPLPSAPALPSPDMPSSSSPSLTLLPLTIPPLSSSPIPPPEITDHPSTTTSGKSPNVLAIAIGVTGAVLLLTVCAAIIFYRRKWQNKKLPPSAEFMDVVVAWPLRTHHETSSPTSSMFTQKQSLRANEV